MVVLEVFYDKERSQYFERPIVNKELQLWKNACTALKRGDECMLLVVVESIGSSPGRAGFKALVTSAGALHGSIGGGSMEHKLVELARSQLKTAGFLRTSGDPTEVWNATPSRVLLKRQIHRANEPTDRSGMICSGEQTVALLPLHSEDLDRILQIIKTLEKKRTTDLSLSSSGFTVGSVASPSGFQKHADLSWSYKEQIGQAPRIIILGAGHVGLALSRTMHQLGFHVHLMDDRRDLNTMANNQWAHVSSVVDYVKISELIPSDPDLYIVLVSFGYRTDDILVRQLIRNQFNYLGMMGSAEKINTLFAGLRKDGFREEEIGRVRAPIGLAIGSRTPEEIAVSIAAEIISVRNNAGNSLSISE